MTDIKRFDPSTYNTHYYGVPVIEECEDGDYVLSADYDALKEERDQQIDTLQSELNEARTSIAHLLIELDAVKVPDGDWQRTALDHSAQSLGMVGALVTALYGLLSITQDSAGVAGYHLNGNVAEWDEFPEVSTALDVLNLYRERADKPCFFGIYLAQGALDAGPLRDAIIDQGWKPHGKQQASDKVPCKTHPDAPNGFCRNSSHTDGRYVCECEHWEEPRASAAQSAPAGEREAFRSWCESIGYPAALMTCGDLAAFKAGASEELAQRDADNTALRDALSDIVLKVSQSRSETRRLTWIAGRAESALEGKPWAKQVFMMPDPKNGQPKAERLKAENAELKARIAALEAELATVKKVAYGNMEFLEENAKLRAELERQMINKKMREDKNGQA